MPRIPGQQRDVSRFRFYSRWILQTNVKTSKTAYRIAADKADKGNERSAPEAARLVGTAWEMVQVNASEFVGKQLPFVCIFVPDREAW